MRPILDPNGAPDNTSFMNDLSIDALEFNPDLDLNGSGSAEQDVIRFSNSPPRNTSNPRTSEGSNNGSGQQQQSINNALSDTRMSGAGAGPLPTGYGMQLPLNFGSTLTEFTKRRNWSQRIVEEIRDFLHILSPDGRIIYVSPSTQTLTGYEPSDLVGRFIISFVHPDDTGMFVREFNESIASGIALRFFYRFRNPDNSYAIFEAHGHPHLATEASSYGPQNGASVCRGFFMMARLYPTKNAALLDSFLEHKMENERLKKRIADLKREEREEMEAQGRSTMLSSSSPTAGDQRDGQYNGYTNSYGGMPPPAKPGTANAALTQRNLNEALTSAQPDTIIDKMARSEGASHYETIEMLTGLRYRDGERSNGISTGATSPILIKGDAGISTMDDRDDRSIGGKRYPGSPFDQTLGKTHKRPKVDEYMCTDCGTLDSPEWRKGPNGPKTLCNACGLRWAKKEKRKSISLGQNGRDSTPSTMMGGTNGGGSGRGSLQTETDTLQPVLTRLLPESGSVT